MFFNMPNQGLSGITGSQSFTSPSLAAQFLHQLNKSTFTSELESGYAVTALDKCSISKTASRQFLNEWKNLQGYSSDSQASRTIRLNGAGLAAYSANQKKIEKLGDQIYDMATEQIGQIAPAKTDAQIQAEEDALRAAYEQSQNLSTGSGVAEDVKAAFTDATLQSGESEAKKMKANGTGINIRELPSASAKILGKVSNATVSVSNKDPGTGGWTRIIYNGKPAFISTNLLAPVGTANKKTSTGEIAPIPQENPPPDTSAGLTVTQKALIVGGVVTVAGLLLFLTRKK